VISEIIAVVGLVLVLEGALPFLSPGLFRMAIRRLVSFSNGELRWLGFGSMFLGLLLVKLFR